jgi:hypothetical protein
VNRGAPLRRTAFKRKPPVRVTLPLDDDLVVTLERIAPRLYRVPAPSAAVFNPQPKREYVVDEGYRRAVAALPCYRCGIVGFSNACHSDSGADGKGERIKACDLTCWPGCVARGFDAPGCHFLVGMTALMNRGEKRAFELRAAADTQATLITNAAGDAKLRAVLARVGLIRGTTA